MTETPGIPRQARLENPIPAVHATTPPEIQR